MMDKRKYFSLGAVSGIAIRALVYPFSLIKTRLQVQRHHSSYNSLFDAFRKIVKMEGFKGLYRGFLISNFTIVSQISYIGAYEAARNYLVNNTVYFQDQKIRSFIAGGFASLVGQTAVLPIDIVTQHLQVINLRRIPSSEIPLLPKSKIDQTRAIVKYLYKQNGVRAFYKGYFTSLATYAPSSALWWFFYDIYCTELDLQFPTWVPRLTLQCLAAPLGGATTTIIMTPMDAIRARIQVENKKFIETTKNLWAEERFGILTKGLSARMVQSILFSFLTILSYESIKRWSLLEEYKALVRW
ncbi:hypothetical protein HELRODRAFT_95765 [Helobdella robusta]|uniref:Solute carrier family 25 member 44 n=1 Tax=Helobdella robusta TaxID=6412 RepID=T1G974_HELRO|nr:hypothetical protein HELRODRAFT_95765 [Helobdella robusta]ESN94614.1 hypothetical protein HELRODRAFT_95765 [Helobdella robusta]